MVKYGPSLIGMQDDMARDNVNAKQEVAKNQEILGVKCRTCGSTNNFIESYSNTRQEGNGWMGRGSVSLPEKV